MRTTEYDDRTWFIHHGDYSGDVEIVHNGQTLTLPAAALRFFVAQQLNEEALADAEVNETSANTVSD